MYIDKNGELQISPMDGMDKSEIINDRFKERQTMIEQTIREKIAIAVKAHDNATRDILRTTLGEIQRIQGRPSDETALATIKKMIKNIDTTILLCQDKPGTVKELDFEKTVLSQFVPKSLNKEEIIAFIALKSLELKDIPEGKAMGLLIKSLKDDNQLAEPLLIKEILAEIRK